MVLVAIAEGWKDAAPYRDTFEALASRTVAMVVNKNREIQSSPSAAIDVEGQESWARWINDMAETGVLDGVDGLLAGFINDFSGHGGEC